MRYALARWNLYQRDEVYRIYVTDALKWYGKFETRYIDIFKPEETRTAEDIINRLRSGLEKVGGQDGPIQSVCENNA